MNKIDINNLPENYLKDGITIDNDDGTQEIIHIPYNDKNILVTEDDLLTILSNSNVELDKINKIEEFHKAFTHKSYLKRDIYNKELLKKAKIDIDYDNLIDLRDKSYERLEWLGDRVIKLSVSHYLFHRYPDEDEGFMTRLQTKIEDKSNLSIMAQEIGLPKYFIVSKQIENNQGRVSSKICEDCFEAFLGALWISNGLDPCLNLMINLLETEIDYSRKLYLDNNYKDKLLRYFHNMKWGYPKYYLIKEIGPSHKKNFIMGIEKPENYNETNLTINKKFINEEINSDYDIKCGISYGNGNSKKEGEQKSAKMALIKFNQLNDDQYDNEDLYYPNWNELFNDDNIEENNLENEYSEIFS